MEELILIKINDADEKKMIIAYQKLCSNKTAKNLLCNSSVYSTWIMRWRNDFVVNGKCLKIWHQELAVSANKHRKGIEPPEYYKEYNKFINDITDWMNNNYEIKQGRRNNKRKYAEMLIEHRKICADKVVTTLKECTNLSDCKLVYILPNKTDKIFTELVNYSLIYNGVVIFKGSCDEIVEYMIKTDSFITDKKKGIVENK